MHTTLLHTCPKHLLALAALLALLCALGAPAHAASSSPLGSQFPLYVTSLGNNAIVTVDRTGAQSVFTAGGNLDNPVALAFDGSGNLYVVNQPNAIVTVDSTGVQSVITTTIGNIREGLALDGSGNLYVTTEDNHSSIIKVDSTGAQSIFTSGGYLDIPTGLAFDGSGNLYVASANNNTIVKVDSTGVQSIFTSGGYLAGPDGLAFDSSGNLYVANLSNNTIVKVDSTGAQNVFTAGGYLDTPFGLAFDGSGTLYVASAFNNTIVKVDSTGTQSVFTADGDLLGPIGLAFTRGYNFGGFLQPVDSPPTVNVAKAGAAIPVRFSLGSDHGLGILAPGSPTSQQVTCNTSDPLSTLEATVTAGGSSLSYDPTTQLYTYVWKTSTAWKGTCRQLVVKLNDGSTHTANFQFK